MKYFTPELYLRFNSPDLDVAEKAHEDWDEAIRRYRDHLIDVAPQLTKTTQELSQSLCLHDAEYRGIEWTFLPDGDGRLATIFLQHNNAEVLLVYILIHEPSIQELAQWPFSKEKVHWLYDEFDAHPDGRQQHEILFSDGRVFTLKFRDMSLMRMRQTSETIVSRSN
jgi:hypothetical protein